MKTVNEAIASIEHNLQAHGHSIDSLERLYERWHAQKGDALRAGTRYIVSKSLQDLSDHGRMDKYAREMLEMGMTASERAETTRHAFATYVNSLAQFSNPLPAAVNWQDPKGDALHLVFSIIKRLKETAAALAATEVDTLEDINENIFLEA